MNKEQAYDEVISPLMQQIIQAAKEHGIAMMASFDLAHDGEGPNGEDCSILTCNSLLPDGDGNPNELFAQANALIRRGNSQPSMGIKTVNGDGSQTFNVFI